MNDNKNLNRYQKTMVCSNLINDYGNFLVIGDVAPIQFTKSKIPKVTVKALLGESNGKKDFIDIVINSVSQHQAVKVYEKDNTVKVQVQNTIILSAYQKDDDTVVIDHLDLSPIGFDIHGSNGGLRMGGMTLSSNTVSGGAALLGS